MCYFKVPLGVFRANQHTVGKVKPFSLTVSQLFYWRDCDKKYWVRDYEARRRKRGTSVSG